ncbi:MAG: hypothetical protein A3H97_04785 [Acidobacteria bacterium RIFCSPLOWO2_02_FULL_65_29]|nr:MAG: hypothetical protein A3H97_04785 [Acidobacteria bacterium RIFCSPLOWO2_02_FULL_65_29]
MKAFELRIAALLVATIAMFATALQAQRTGDASKPVAASQGPEATEVWTDHLKIKNYPSQPEISPGRPVSLVVEIEPGARMHVYAPGADDYQVITLRMAEQPFVRLPPVQYPASEIYVFEPLDERIPVYQRPFKLIQDVTLDTRPEALAAFRSKPSLKVTGTLEYQACDDKVCFKPVSVPLSWTLALRPSGAQGSGGTPAS